jgi:hypothetical protein
LKASQYRRWPRVRSLACGAALAITGIVSLAVNPTLHRNVAYDTLGDSRR